MGSAINRLNRLITPTRQKKGGQRMLRFFIIGLGGAIGTLARYVLGGV